MSTAASVVFEHTSDAVLVLDASSRIVEANGAAQRLLGGRDPLVGLPVARVLPGWGPLERDAGEGAASELESESESESEVVWQGPDGAGVGQLLRVRAVPRVDEQGRAAGRVLLLRGAQGPWTWGSPRQQQGFFELVVHNSPVAIVTISRDFRVMSWNPAAERLFGYTPREALGRDILQLLARAEDVREEAEQASREVLLRGRVHSVTRRVRKDGSVVDVELLALPVSIGDEQAGFIAIYHDITDLQRARQAAEAANEAKSLFLATMSHEIRTPLGALLGMTDLLLSTALTDEQRDFARTIQQSGDALLALLDDILDFSKIEAGRLELERHPFEVRECVESVLDLLAARAGEKGLELGYAVAAHTPQVLLGDGARLRQVLLNLVGNAVKFTERGAVAVAVEVVGAGAGTDESWELRFSVQDTGLGIPAQKQQGLFQPFRQLDASVARRFGGSGLGLAICKRLVEAMGGALWVESEGVPGRGSTFHFTLRAPALAQPWAGHLDPEQPLLRGRRALIIDDNALGRRMLGLQLRSWGLEPVEAASGAEALARLEGEARIDVALVDHHLPPLDGVALAERLRQQRAAGSLPLLLLTSRGPHASRPAAPYAAVLTRPVKVSHLYDALVTSLVPDVSLEQLGPSRRARDSSPFGERLGETLPLRILLAEDNATNQKLGLLVLERLGYRADVATNGHQALLAVGRQRYDVVLMDMQMPEMDGLEATRRIRGELPAALQPRIIAMTANALDSDRRQCLQAGMDDYLSKPLRVEALVAALRRSRSREGYSTPFPFPAPQPHEEPGPSLVVPGLEPSALLRLRREYGELLGRIVPELIDTALQSMPGLLVSARQALAQQELEELGRAAHTLKSNAAYFGAAALEALCREMELRAGEGRWEGQGELLGRCEAEFERVRGLLERLRASVRE